MRSSAIRSAALLILLTSFLVTCLADACRAQTGARVAAGWRHTLAAKSDGTVWAWGYNSNGQLGQGTFSTTLPFSIASPVPVSGLSGVVAVAAGNLYSLAVKDDGTVWAWGDNRHGQLGQGTVSPNMPFSGIAIPVQVSGLSGVLAVAAGRDHSLALKCDGTVWAWGKNDQGQLGNGTYSAAIATPTQVSGLSEVVAVAAGQDHGLAVKSDGTIWAWGSNFIGELGQGTFTTTSPLGIAVPVQVPGLSAVVAVAAGLGHSLAVKSDGTVWAWGNNFNGQLGLGVVTSISPFGIATPMQVSGLSGIESVGAGFQQSFAVKCDGTVWAWGHNIAAQLGLGPSLTIPPFRSESPVQVPGLSGVVAIGGGESHSMCAKNDGTVWAWGQNFYGQLGQGTFTSTTPNYITSPVQVPIFLPASSQLAAARVSIKRITSGGSSPWPADFATVSAWVQGASTMLGCAGISLTLSEFVDIADPAAWYSAPIGTSTRDAMETAAEISPCPYAWRQDAINIYLTDGGGGAIGSLPFSQDTSNDLVLLGSGFMSSEVPHILAHELGHYFGLLDTFESANGVEGPGSCINPASNCATAGDGICDTPFSPPITAYPADDGSLVALYGNGSCEYARLRWNVMSYYGGISAADAVLTPGQAARVAIFRPYRTNVFLGGTALTRGCLFTQAGPSSLTLLAPSAPNAPYATVPTLSAPRSIFSGLVVPGGGGEFRLLLTDPAIPIAISGVYGSGFVGVTDGTGTAVTTLALPSTPSLTGIVLYWQSIVFGPNGIMTSQILPTTFQ